LFHEKVILCEGDADCRFYAAVMDAVYESKPEAREPDIMFTHCGGKTRMPLIVKSLRAMDVPLEVVADFDVLSDEHPLREIVEAAGGQWEELANDWRIVKQAIEAKKPELNTAEVVKELHAITAGVSEAAFPLSARERIQQVLRRSSPWFSAKAVGAAYVPSGDPTQACERVLEKLRGWRIHVVPLGEIEAFVKSVGGHGPAWVNEALKKDLLSAELRDAREFVNRFTA
jgi:hypothetical protein